ncbi:MAG: hypothetical protein Alpg2KO_12450 [Alphaproteobacteria bacterium]
MANRIQRRGVTGVSTGLLVGLISIVALVAVQGTGDSTNSLFESVARVIGNDVVGGGRRDLPGNDAPEFTAGGSVTISINEDAGPISLNNNLSVSDPDQDQTLTWSASSPPASGTLSGLSTSGSTGFGGIHTPSGVSFMPDADENGIVTATLQVSDGADTDTLQVTFDIEEVNDAPTFGIGGNQSHAPGEGAQTVGSFATGFNPGPANESGQSLQAYQVVEVSDPGNAISGTSIDSSGTLSYTVSSNSGTANFEVRAQDNGGTANGGTDLSAPLSFSITVNAVAGQHQFTSPGTHNWVAPSGVTSVSVVAVGAGGGGGGCHLSSVGDNAGGGGGALVYRNNIRVTPGQSYTVIVGTGGARTTGCNGNSGGSSSFGGLFTAGGGSGAVGASGGNGGTPSGSYTAGHSGGRGGNSGSYGGGGGGAAGYSGNGGAGGSGASSSGVTGAAGAGGGGGGGASGHGGGGGGGVGINGIGSSGASAGGAPGGCGGGRLGNGGSGGSNGVNGGTNGTCGGGDGGDFGGGGSGGADGARTSGGGGDGAVRIIWGTGRSFPNNAN